MWKSCHITFTEKNQIILSSTIKGDDKKQVLDSFKTLSMRVKQVGWDLSPQSCLGIMITLIMASFVFTRKNHRLWKQTKHVAGGNVARLSAVTNHALTRLGRIGKRGTGQASSEDMEMGDPGAFFELGGQTANKGLWIMMGVERGGEG